MPHALTTKCFVTSYEFSAKITNLLDHYTSNKFILLLGWSHMYSELSIDLQKTFCIVSNNRANKDNVALVSTFQDYVYLDILDKDKMSVFKYTTFNKQV